MNLFEKAKLTEAEIGSLAAWRAVSSHEFYADQRLIADAAAAKALWMVADELDRYILECKELRDMYTFLNQLVVALEEAGMKRPKP